MRELLPTRLDLRMPIGLLLRQRSKTAAICCFAGVLLGQSASSQSQLLAGANLAISQAERPHMLRPIEQRAREYLARVQDSTSHKQAARYVKESFTDEALKRVSAEDRIEDLAILRYLLGPFRIIRIEAASATDSSVIIENGMTGRLQKLPFRVEDEAPHRIADIGPLQTLTGLETMPRNDRERVEMLDAFVMRLASADFFSGSVLLARNGSVILEKTYGPAERRFTVPNTPDTRFYLGSITKSFTAVAIAQLVEQGKLSWEDPLVKFLPDFPTKEAASKIRLKHLLSHTSGLTNTPYPPGQRLPTQSRTITEMVAAAPRNPLLSEPGTRYQYNNLGYLLLGRVIELASGEDYYRYLQQHVFDRAGMRAAGTDHYDVVDQLSYAYEPIPSLERRTFVDGRLYVPARAVPFGGAYGTARDLLRFSSALRSGVLIRPATFRIMSTAKPELGASRTGYGFGIGTNELSAGVGRRFIGHGGNAVGVCTWWGHFEDAAVPYTFVVLANSGQRACNPVVEHILELVPPSR